MNLKELLTAAKKNIPSLDADILACHVFGLTTSQLITKDTQGISSEQQKRFETLVAQRKNGHSISEILGVKEFYGNTFSVTNDVLTPRPETEVLVETAFEYIQKHNISRVIDIGTGSGCISITLAQITKNTIPVLAVDISEKALTVAQKNKDALAQKQSTVELRKSDLLSHISTEEIENACIVTNLPYIPETDILDRDVMNGDPALALFSGTDGTDLYEQLFKTLPNSFAALFFEFHPPQKEYFYEILSQQFPERSVEFFADLSGDIRFGKVI